MLQRKTNRLRGRQHKGLILLLALGMLALFSLLAVTWVVSASASRTGAQAMRVRANNSTASVRGLSNEVMKLALRGTRDHKSAFYQHALLEDIYDSNSIRVQFGHRFFTGGGGDFKDKWCRKLTPATGPGVELIKLSIDPRNPSNPTNDINQFRLNALEGAYNGRVLTILEGPLTGQSFRILKYVGYVPSSNDTVADPNITGGTPLGPKNTYSRQDATDYDYSIVIDLSTVRGKVEGRWRASSGLVENFSGEIGDWLALPNGLGLRNLFYFCDTSTGNYQGYKCLINGAAFNNAGIGLEDRPSESGFGNLDMRSLMAIPSNASRPKIPPALLPNYDYIQNGAFMAGGGVSSIGDFGTLKGQSNEGIDVPDWRDFWLAHDTYITAGNRRITPSFHRPELIYYLSHVFGSPSSPAEVGELLRLIDASTARVMSYSYQTPNGLMQVNPNFSPSGSFPTYTADQARAGAPIIGYLQQLIDGAWDVDNDGDGVPDSVWINPNLPAIRAADGRLLKPLAAVMIQDLDGRLNLNLHGDRTQGTAVDNFNGGVGFNVFCYSEGLQRFTYKRNPSLLLQDWQKSVPQGFGFGPADISLNPLFGNSAAILKTNSNYSIFDMRYGAKPYLNQPFNPQVDRWPGGRLNDPMSAVTEREIPLNGVYVHSKLPGAPLGRRSAVAPAFDRNGNLTFLYPQVADVLPEGGINQQDIPSEVVGDAYESGSGVRNYGDTPFTLSDLESILRRFDEDIQALPSDVKTRLNNLGISNSSEVNKLLTTLSAELRYPKLAAAAVVPNGNNYELRKDAGNMLGFIRMLHEQRYRKRSLPSPMLTDEYPLTLESLNELFPPEFSSNLKMNLNRAFGNGLDDNNNGQIDEPTELAVSPEQEMTPASTSVGIGGSGVSGYYTQGLNQKGSATRRYLGSRQLLARYLYCLAQLIVPRDHEFPSMSGIPAANQLVRDRLRARFLAQWAVNVIDFRDADSTMTRFEYDIYPFGIRGVTGISDRYAFWAPDRLVDNSNQPVPAVRPYVDVVWGMEQPELLLTESLAFHDKRLRDTDMDDGPRKETSNGDPDFDQYRFPQGSLFLELYAPRSTYVATDPVLPGVSSSLYTLDNNSGRVKLWLNKMAPVVATWNRQPVWRIGLSDNAPPNSNERLKNPNVLYQGNDNNTNRLAWRDPQVATSTAIAGDPAGSTVEARLGGGVYSALNNFSTTAETFDRFIYFGNPGNSLPRVPNLKGNDATEFSANRAYQVYFNRTTPSADQLLMDGGSYLVIGPRTDTFVGSLTNNPDSGAPWSPKLLKSQLSTNRPISSPAHQSISLAANSITTRLLNGESISRYRPDWMPAIKAPQCIVAAAPPPPTAAGTTPTWTQCFPNGVGINISMPNPIPNQGYWIQKYLPTTTLNSQDRRSSRSDNRLGYSELPPDSWVDTATALGSFHDKPMDYQPTVNPILNPTTGSAMTQTGTYDNVRYACLQRLADPDVGYDPITNPYITVDWISIDLTVFNGEAPRGDDPNDSGNRVAFQSRYKDGGSRSKAGTKAGLANAGQPNNTDGAMKNRGYSYHTSSTAQLRTTPYQTLVQPNPPVGGPQGTRYSAYFMAQLGYATQQPQDQAASQPMHNSATTLGYLNTGYRLTNIVGQSTDTADDFDGFGPPQLVPTQTQYNGTARDMTAPVWLNRTFANANELMMVPWTSPGQFGYYYGIAADDTARTPFEYLPSFQISNSLVTNLEATGSSDVSDYVPTTMTPAAIKAGGYWMRRSGEWPNQRGAMRPPVQGDWAMILDFVETPPSYVDTAKRLDPKQLSDASLADPWAARFLSSYIPPNYTGNGEGDTSRGTSLLAPNNLVPSYVNPGKINLNTVPMDAGGNSLVLQGLEYLYSNTLERQASLDALAGQFFTTRRGFPLVTKPTWTDLHPLGMDPDYPTTFAGAYRSGLATNLYPFAPNSDTSNRPQTAQRGRYATESGVLRSLVPDPTGLMQPNGPQNGNLLFSPNRVAVSESPIPVQLNPADEEEARQQAFTRYQRAMRLPNLTTDQSNAFAVWVTVSLFEYDPVTGFGREYSNTAGEPERERGFYIIDRTVPVGFVLGEDLNSDRAVLLKRTINSKRR